MDLQKTGELIAQRRKELGLTQKILAEKLNISDRTVSKWERGIGFPDVSLIEPLADALNLTVLEIFHGQLETPAPEEENSAREVLNIYRPQMEAKMNRARRWIIALGVLLVLMIVSLPWIISTAKGEWSEQRTISAEEAVKITPNILISTADYELLNTILSDEAVSKAYTTYLSENLYLEGEAVAPYRAMVDINGEAPLFFDISVYKGEIIVKYGTQHTFVALQIYKEEVSKRVILHEFPYLTKSGENIPMGQRHGNRIDLDNFNNTKFSIGGYRTGWLELIQTSYY